MNHWNRFASYIALAIVAFAAGVAAANLYPRPDMVFVIILTLVVVFFMSAWFTSDGDSW